MVKITDVKYLASSSKEKVITYEPVHEEKEVITEEKEVITKEKGIVYVVQEVTGRNILSAEKFGKLELLLPEGSQLVLSAGPTVKRLTYRLRKFNDNDYLLLMGDPVAIGIACAVAATNNRGQFKCLKWDRREYKYYPVEVNLYERGEINE